MSHQSRKLSPSTPASCAMHTSSIPKGSADAVVDEAEAAEEAPVRLAKELGRIRKSASTNSPRGATAFQRARSDAQEFKACPQGIEVTSSSKTAAATAASAGASAAAAGAEVKAEGGAEATSEEGRMCVCDDEGGVGGGATETLCAKVLEIIAACGSAASPSSELCAWSSSRHAHKS